MYTHELRSKIEIEQRKQTNSLIFTLMIVLFSVVTSAVAPQLLYEYVLQGISVDQQLIILQYIPVIAYLISLVAFVMSAVGFLNHRRRTRMIEQEIMLLQYTDEDCNCEDPGHHHHHAEMSSTGEAVVASTVSDLSAALAKSNTGSKTATRRRGRPAAKKASKK